MYGVIMSFTINDLVQEISNHGYHITPSGIKYYIRQGLLSEPQKQGGYKKGVRLTFPEPKVTVSQLQRVFELKTLGFKLSEIKRIMKEVARKRAGTKRRKKIEKIVNINGQLLYKLNDEVEIRELKEDPDDPWTSDLEAVLFDYLYKIPVFKGDSKKVINRQLYIPLYLYKGNFLYFYQNIWHAFAWISLRRSYDFAWDTVEALNNQHIKNFDKYFFLPDANGVIFSPNYITWLRQYHLNTFGSMLESYFGRIIAKTIEYIPIKWDNYGVPISPLWDYKYREKDTFIRDFIDGRCAFVPTPDNDLRYFLKKFDV